MHVGHLSGFGLYGMVHNFHECFRKSLHGCNLLLTIQNLFLLPRDIGFSTNEGVLCQSMYREHKEGSRSLHMLDV